MPIQPKEIWKQIRLAQDYQVSNLGRVARLKPGGNHTYPGKVLKITLNRDGYWTLCLYVNGKVKRFFVHRLVADAFLGRCPDGYQVNHKDLDKKNATVSNLEYTTGLENIRHAVRNGKRFGAKNGEDNVNAKLTIESVRKARKLYQTNNYTFRDLAKIFEVSHVAIALAVKSKTWQTVSNGGN